MKTRLRRLVLALALLGLPLSALADGGLLLLGAGRGNSTFAPLAIDGTPGHNSTTAASTTVTISPKARSVAFACITTNNTTVSSITSANLIWQRRVAVGGANNIELWFALVGGANLSGEVVTVTLGGSQFVTVDAWAISGADTAYVFDQNAILPVTGAASPLAVNTTNANDMIIACARGGTAAPTAGAGYTTIKTPAADFQLTEQKIVSATQSGLSVTTGEAANGMIADAVMQDAGRQAPASFYVATAGGGGSDANAGTLAAPFLTLTKCQTAMRAAPTTKNCVIRGGTYPNVAAKITLSALDSGTTWSYYSLDGVNTAIFTGNDTFAGPLFEISGINITIDGLNIGHFATGVPDCIHVISGASGTIIRNNEVHHSTQYCILLDGVSSGTTVNNNYVHDIGFHGISGFEASGTINNTSILNNFTKDTNTAASDGGAIYFDTLVATTGLQIKNNYTQDMGAGGGGIGVYLDDRTSTAIVSGNVARGMASSFSCYFVHGGSSNAATGNICDLATNNLAGIAAAQFSSGAMSGNTWSNNLVLANIAGANAGGGYACNTPTCQMTIGPNSYQNYTGSGINHTGSLGTESTYTYQDPNFTCGWTYTLPSNSPVFSAPTLFPAQPASWGAAGYWGPPGFTIPRTGTVPSPAHAC